MKKTLICALALAFVCSLGFAGMSMAEAEKGPAEINMIDEAAPKPKLAVFPHAAHQKELKCAECHHGQDDAGKQIAYVDGQEIKKCATCHTGDMLKDGDNKVKGKTAMQRAGHGNCLKCHKEIAKKDAEKKAMKKCTTCHPKKKK